DLRHVPAVWANDDESEVLLEDMRGAAQQSCAPEAQTRRQVRRLRSRDLDATCAMWRVSREGRRACARRIQAAAHVRSRRADVRNWNLRPDPRAVGDHRALWRILRPVARALS